MLDDAILDGDSNEENKVIIFDGMAIVNLIDIKKQKIKICLEFASAFFSITIKKLQGFSEVRVTFDRYGASSLKSYSRTTHRAGDLIQYKIHDKSKIGHLGTKEFLANNETKNDLTQYLAEKMVKSLATVAYAIVFGNTYKTNIDINENLFKYNQKEADTGIVLHALDATQRNPFSELVISCSDTYILLILLRCCEYVCSSITFKARNKETYLRTVHHGKTNL